MNVLQNIFGITWRSLLVMSAYFAGIMLAGILGGMLGWQTSSGANASSGTNPLAFLAPVFLLGVFLGPIAQRLKISRIQQFIVWYSLIIFNLGSVALEGAYFAPELVKMPVPILLVQQSFATIGAALAITLLFAPAGFSASWLEALRARPWYSWLWRLVLSASSYLTFYFVFGGLNYSMVTKPYYETHAGGLTVPAPEVVLILEAIRGLLIALSVLVFLLSFRGTRRQLIGTTGWLLFAIGGIIPLLWQISSLPLFLLFASAIEIFFQNFLTGAVCAWLLGVEKV